METDREVYKKVESCLAANWFNNAKNKQINEQILFMDIDFYLYHKIIKSVLGRETYNYQIYSISDVLNRVLDSQKNILILNDDGRRKGYFARNGFRRLFSRKILFLSSDSLFINNNFDLDFFVETNQCNQINTLIKGDDLCSIEKKDPLEIVKQSDKDRIYDFILNRKQKIYAMHFPRNQTADQNILFNGTTFKEEDFEIDLRADINLLKNEILTSRLATIIYRLSTGEIEASTTETGRYFRKNLGIRSSVFSYDSIKNRPGIGALEIDPNKAYKKSFKAYDLAAAKEGMTIRKEIAKNIINLNYEGCGKETIAKVTQLPIEEVEKLYT